MWLLDVNLPNGLAGLLHGYGISCDTAAFREGFRVILTRDRLFGMSARRVLVALPGLAIVVVTLPQAREEAYLGEFEMQRRRKPIEAVAGAVVEWP
jgi:hypothetical protein